MEDITTTEGQKEVQNCESCNNSTDNNDKAANETQLVFIETSETVPVAAAVVKEAQPTTSTTLDVVPEEEDGKECDSLPHLDEVATSTTTSTLPSPEEVSHKSGQVEITSPSPPIQNEMEVEKTPEPHSGSALFTPNVKVEADGSIVVISSGGSMEVDSQTQEEEGPSTTNPNKPLSAELQVLGCNSSSFIEMKKEETIQKADEQNHQNDESHVIEKRSDASCADTMTTMMDMVPRGSDATTPINYKGEVGSSMRSRG